MAEESNSKSSDKYEMPLRPGKWSKDPLEIAEPAYNLENAKRANEEDRQTGFSPCGDDAE